MKKILALVALISFYLLTQLNFTTISSTGKNSCDNVKLAAKKCTKLLSQHQSKLKQIETSYKKASLDYSVNLTAQNSAFIESYLVVARETAPIAEETTTASRSPASTCESEDGQYLKTCMDEAKKIYQTLVPN